MASCPCLRPTTALQAGCFTLRLRRLESDAEGCCCATVAAGAGATPAAFYLGLCRLRGILPLPASHDHAAGGPFFFAAAKIRIGHGESLSRRSLQAGHSSLQQRRLESDTEDRCRVGRCRRAILLFSAATKIRIGHGRSLSRRSLQAGHSSLRQQRLDSDAEDLCR